MKLFVKDRFYLLNLLPQKPVDYKTYNLKKELVKQVQLSEDQARRGNGIYLLESPDRSREPDRVGDHQGPSQIP